MLETKHHDYEDIMNYKMPANVQTFSPLVSPEDLIRAVGRLNDASISDGAKNSILLSRKSFRIVSHSSHSHVASGLNSGPSTTQCLIVQEYWILLF